MSHQPVFDMPNFDRITIDKLAYYYIVAQRTMYKLQRRTNIEALAPLYEIAEREWKADPINNPTTFPPNPLTVEVVKTFYGRCDAICSSISLEDSIPKLLRLLFASSNGAQFITGVMLAQHRHPSMGKIFRNASAKLNEALSDHEQVGMGSDRTHAQTVSPGEILCYLDANNGECSIRIKDHGSSVMRGEFYIVTTILDEAMDLEGECDREMKADEMEQLVRNRIE